MDDKEIIQIIENAQRRMDRETAPHFQGGYGGDAAAICRALREAGALA